MSRGVGRTRGDGETVIYFETYNIRNGRNGAVNYALMGV